MLYDKDFLLKLDKQKNKIIFARITALTFQETPIEYIEGRVTQGSISLDGASAVRRTCSLTIVAQDFNYSDYYWGLNTKFKLEIGVKNTIDASYPEIIWFNQGIYLITSFNTSRTVSSFNISIQGKDKMCLLNGEVSGSLESSIDFGTIEEEDQSGNWVIRKLPLQDIIRNIVHIYGGEPYHNIIINDLDTYGLELLEYRLDTPIYFYRSAVANASPVYRNVMIENDDVPLYKNAAKTQPIKMSQLSVADGFLEPLMSVFDPGRSDLKPIYTDDGKPWYFTKISYGETAGYRQTELVFAGDLIAKVGESVTSVLDKIKNMLVEFEYFYNLDGQFIFQKKQSFTETMWSTKEDEVSQQLQQGKALSSTKAYEFFGGELVTAFNNNPNLLNLKNDYSIWGERESVSGAKVPIHMRYAIDKKPVYYHPIWTVEKEGDENEFVKAYNQKYGTQVMDRTKADADKLADEIAKLDWREIIYQMSLDFYQYNFLDDFELKVAQANPNHYPTGVTGYEGYYVDLQGFWRQLYYPNLSIETSQVGAQKEKIKEDIEELTLNIYGTPVEGYGIYTGGIENDLICLNNYVSQKIVPALDIYPKPHTAENFIDYIGKTYKFKDEDENIITGFGDDGKIDEGKVEVLLSLLNEHYFRQKAELEIKKAKYDQLDAKYASLEYDQNNNYYVKDSDVHKNWNKFVFESPSQLNFWFDFLDTPGEMSKYSVQTIGARSKAINDTNIKSIYFRETPPIIFKDQDETIIENAGFRYIQASNIDSMFSCSAQGKSAKEKLDELIYQHSYCIESATITSVPIYYLEPNTRIYLHDETTGLDGDYIVSKITIPLQYNGTMSITATKAAENIL